MTREQLKSLALVALFGLCTVLVSQIWTGMSISRFNTATRYSEYQNAGNVLDVIYPQSYTYNFGGGLRTEDFSDKNQMWDQLKPNLLKILSQKHNEAEITEAEFWEKTDYRSVRFEFAYDLSPNNFLDMAESNQLYIGKMESFDTLLFTASYKSSFYIGSQRDKKYYRIDSSVAEINIEEMLKKIENRSVPAFHTVEEHYSLKESLGETAGPEFVENKTMVPILGVDTISIIHTVPQWSREREGDPYQDIANKAFQNELAFIKKLVDVNGSVIYQYGYNEKALRISANGILDYQERPDPSLASVRTDFIEALKTALSFLKQVGGVPETLYLANYAEVGDGYGYRFEFAYTVDGVPVMASNPQRSGDLWESNAPIQIEIEGKQVLKCERQMIDVEGYTDGVTLSAMNLDAVIEKNIDEISYHYSQRSGDADTDNPLFGSRILQSIRSVRVVYYSEANIQHMLPAWEVNIAGAILYFNLYDGRLLSAFSQGVNYELE